MDFPEEFCIESDIGMFLMARKGSSFGRAVYEGCANGFVCELRLGSDLSYKVLLSDACPGPSCGPVRCKGRAQTLEGLAEDVALWMDSEMWGRVEDPGERDTYYMDTSCGRIAYYCYNTHFNTVPVLFLHGGPGDGAGTSRMRRLHLRHPVYTYDQMGCGRSDPIPDMGRWNHEDYFRELNEFIERMGFERVILIGASWGAGLAAGYVIRFGCGRIDCMVLPSPFFSSKRWEEDQWANLSTMSEEYGKEMRDYIDGKGTLENYRHVMSAYYSRFLFTRECNREIAEEAANTEQNPVFRAMWGTNDMVCTGTMRDFDLIPDLSKITVPVLFMCGDSDEVTLETMLGYQRAVRGSRLSVIPFAGHVLSMEQSDAYCEAVRSYLREYGH